MSLASAMHDSLFSSAYSSVFSFGGWFGMVPSMAIVGKAPVVNSVKRLHPISTELFLHAVIGNRLALPLPRFSNIR
jgi:hypothetical protein